MRKVMTLVFFIAAIQIAAAQAIAQNAVLTNPTGAQIVVQPPGTFLGVNSLNSIYYASQWCTTPGTLDETCVNNAIADIQAHGPIKAGGFPTGQILIDGTKRYYLNNSIVIPYGVDISLFGESYNNLQGTEIQPNKANMTLIQVQADTVDIHDLLLNSGCCGGTTGISLGTASHFTSGARVRNMWYQGMSVAVHLVNVQGMDLSDSTCDDNVQYCILSTYNSGDIAAAGIIATNMNFFGQQAAIYIWGNAASDPNDWSRYTFSGFWSYAGNAAAGQSGSSSVFYNVNNVSLSGTNWFNAGDDIQFFYVNGGNVGPFTNVKDGRRFVLLTSCTNINVHDAAILGTAQQQTPGTYAVVETLNSRNISVHGITTTAPSGFLANASYGLKIDAGTAGSVIYGNSFNAQTVSAYSVLDTTATFLPQIGISTVAGQAACIKSAGPPPVLGYCSTAVTASGSCTCN
jgi:hypothetical protein